MAEDLVLWCSPGFGWFTAPAGFSTGSSLLPQKRNPDLFELARAKSGRLLANAQRVAILLKGLPSGYQKDLQEDKEAVFDTADTLTALLDVLPAAITALKPVQEKMAASLTPDLLAVELADALVDEGVPFRDAHGAVGKLWAAAEQAGVTPAEMSEVDRIAVHKLFTTERMDALSVESALARRNHEPGTGPLAVERQIRRAEGRLGIGSGIDDENLLDATDGVSGLVPGRSSARGARMAEHADAERPVAGTAEGSVPGTSPGAPAGAPREFGAARSTIESLGPGLTIRRARPADVPGIAGVMADYILQGTLLPRPVSELYQCVREFHVVTRTNDDKEEEIVACAALRLLWADLGEVRSLAVRPDHHGLGLGGALVRRVLDDARDIELPRVIALTREVEFFERCGFTIHSRDSLPRKVWTDCVRCPRRHACDEVAVVCDLVPGATAAASQGGRSWTLPIPPPAQIASSELPIVS
jgi:N-acetylglutamate synthase-like GNAT family acetyltransferase